MFTVQEGPESGLRARVRTNFFSHLLIANFQSPDLLNFVEFC
jgi:hypothetical protein